MARHNLQLIISPAKKMRRAGAGSAADDVACAGIPAFPEASQALLDRLRSLSRDELKGLWRTSDKLTDESLAATEALVIPQTADEATSPEVSRLLTPALLTYDGIQYKTMAPDVLEAGALDWLQGHLWVLSALHGCVRPLDAVMPYRLEMAAKLEMPHSAAEALEGTGTPTPCRNLYEYWGELPARHIAQGEDVCVVNLASVEYADAVLPHLAHAGADDETVPCVTCIFGESLRNGKPVQRSTASKAARGSLVRWMAERGVDDAVDLTRFDVGYAYDEALSSPERLVFMRQ